MEELAQILQDPTPLSAQVRLENAERAMLSMPQADCPVSHHFGPGVYVRELSMKAGTWAIGHRQKFEHLNILLKGAVRMVNLDGTTTDLRAPLIFTGQPGRKVGCVLEDMVWLNIYAADERDVEALEAKFIEKSDVWRDLEGARLDRLCQEREPDRLDFITKPMDPVQGRDEPDLGIALVRPSAIHGMGVFVPSSMAPFHTIGRAVEAGRRTALGRYLNHSANPNAMLIRASDGDVEIVSTALIRGVQGGQLGDEVTIDYEQAASLFNQQKELLP